MTDRQDAPDEPGAPPAAEAAHARFPCENCGAALQYRPGADALECPYCGHRNPVRADNPWEAAEALRELDFHAAVASRLDAEETVSARVVHCESCGADVEFDESEEAKTCPFCAAPIVAAPQRHEMLRPRGVLPFLIEEREARKAMTDWLGRLWFAPSGLQEYARKGRRMDGIYTPYWTFDAEADTRYAGQRGDTYFVTRQVRVMVDGKPQMQVRQVPKIRWTRVAGRVRRPSTTCSCSPRAACRGNTPTRWRPGICRRWSRTARSSSRASGRRPTPSGWRRASPRRAT